MGLHTGEAVRRGSDYAGAALVRCARLVAVAQGGQVLLSEATATLARDALPDATGLHDVGLFRLADVARPVRLFQLGHARLPAPVERGPVPEPPDGAGGASGDRQASLQPASPGRRPARRRAQPAPPADRPGGPGAGGGGGAPARRRPAAGDARRARRRRQDAPRPARGAPTSWPRRPAPAGLPTVPDGVWFVDLAPLADAALVPQAVGGRRRRPGGARPGADRRRSPRRCARAPCCSSLDNCEHLVDGSAAPRGGPAARPPRGCACWPPAASRCGAAGEVVYRVPPLATPDAAGAAAPERVAEYPAVRLFVERARAVPPGLRRHRRQRGRRRRGLRAPGRGAPGPRAGGGPHARAVRRPSWPPG